MLEDCSKPLNPMEEFGYKKLHLIEKFLRKISEGEVISIRNVVISKKKKLIKYDSYNNFFLNPENLSMDSRLIDMVNETEIKICYHSSKTKGILWDITTKPKIEDMVVDVFGLKNQGIDKVKLEDISDDSYIY